MSCLLGLRGAPTSKVILRGLSHLLTLGVAEGPGVGVGDAGVGVGVRVGVGVGAGGRSPISRSKSNRSSPAAAAARGLTLSESRGFLNTGCESPAADEVRDLTAAIQVMEHILSGDELWWGAG